ncbi:MAG: anhydro-N-acetylmuramic acid kinase [Planctomycetes bacterium]|nr:anhydro-N-acetylmuramic acid kinase [Planctomycetota bacterium]
MSKPDYGILPLSTMAKLTERYLIGLASGATADGVDAVMVAIAGSAEAMAARQVRHEFLPYGEQLRHRLLSAGGGQNLSPVELALLDRDVALVFADAANSLRKACRISIGKIAAVGSHGHGIAYVPPQTEGSEAPVIGAALQVGSPAVIVEQTQLPVVADFDQGDLAVSGVGGPLEAWPNYILLHHERKARVLVDIGGVASITFLPAGGFPADTLALNSGPGNAVIDALCWRHFSKPYDADGAIAAAAKPNQALLSELLAQSHFHQSAAKRCSRDQWGRTFMERLELMADKHNVTPAELIATTTELTARSIARAIGTLTENPHEVIVCGGGAKNITLVLLLRKLLLPAGTVNLERFDVDVTANEALSFAMLAAARLDGVPANIPAVTGAKRKALLGSVTQV